MSGYLIYGTKSAAVKTLQDSLVILGYDLPKYGADGQLGLETFDALEEFAQEVGAPSQIDPNVGVEDSLVTLLVARATIVKNTPNAVEAGVDWHDISGTHPGKANRGVRRWSSIDTIVLHQTGIFMNNTLKRWEGLRAHIGILSLPTPTIVQVYPLNTYLMHANEANAPSVGIEVNGCFEGIDGRPDTAWRGGYKTNPDKPTMPQVIACRAAIRKICVDIEARGGKITKIRAHRQYNDSRRNDPGSYLWHEVGLWAQQVLGLDDGGPGFKGIKGGRPIPVQWDATRTPYPY